MVTKLTSDLVDFIESGVSLLVGSAGLDRKPVSVRGVGAAVGDDRSSVTVFVPDVLADRLTANLQENPRVAVCLSRPVDHRTLQLKGAVRAVRPSTPAEHALQERYLSGFVEQTYWVGLPRPIVRRMRLFPSTAIEFALEDLFDQTPGPQAGHTLDQSFVP